jgi:hypothetical protein
MMFSRPWRDLLAYPILATLGVVALVLIAPTSEGADPPTVDRIAGSDRYATSAQIALKGYPDGAEVVYLARGDQPADALSALSLPDAPLLLVPACGPVPPATIDAARQLSPESYTVLGGEQAVSGQVVNQLVAMTSDSTARCAGTIPSAAAGVSLSAQRNGRTVTLVLANRSGGTLEAGRLFALERREGAAYMPLDPPVGPFSLEAVNVENGEDFTVATFGPNVVRDGDQVPLEGGEYRARYTVNGTEIAAEFTYP